ncbi:hypothetical protein BB561_004757 [Smittium simulii]|uniref:Uncharacterized protein n=1 Tax=Smittium simulii TaxID=133385 RepID=A0A2T9YEE5_9FUNG|nr:hypothetical protein BB561_004757 [Smittium simulii]
MEDKAAALRKKRQERILNRKRDRLSSIVHSVSTEIEEPLSSPCKELDMDLSLHLEKLNSAMTPVEPNLDFKLPQTSKKTCEAPTQELPNTSSQKTPSSIQNKPPSLTTFASELNSNQLADKSQERELLTSLLGFSQPNGSTSTIAQEFDIFDAQLFKLSPRKLNYTALPQILAFYATGLFIFCLSIYFVLTNSTLDSSLLRSMKAISSFFCRGPNRQLTSTDFAFNPLHYILLVELTKLFFNAFSSNHINFNNLLTIIPLLKNFVAESAA